MITEDYVSFETAKLLKDKGFDQNCATYYLDGQVWRHYYGEVIPKGKQIYAAPTQAIAMRWLREVHNLIIEVRVKHHFRIFDGYYAGIVHLDGYVHYEYTPNEYPTYEQACEVAIKYCLENLI